MQSKACEGLCLKWPRCSRNIQKLSALGTRRNDTCAVVRIYLSSILFFECFLMQDGTPFACRVLSICNVQLPRSQEMAFGVAYVQALPNQQMLEIENTTCESW